MKTTLRICASLFVVCLGQAFAQTSFTLNLGGPANVETIRNSMIFSGGGVSATARSWSISQTGTLPKLAQSEVVQWEPGIGSKNSSEVITTVPFVPYYVDNKDHYDFILFVFDRNVDLTSLSINPSGNNFDTDASYWFGNVNSNISLTGKDLSELSSLGFGLRKDNDTVPSTLARTFSLTGGPTGGANALLVGARVTGDADFDRFKISTIRGNTVTAIPEPSMLGLLAAGVALIAFRRRR
ncbi:PEP-CTERM sorting domain-containing protein [Akkermansiaceae bacterium]|nr:PEP-CTERM sorting domain-containing protein [Akkermansiaceae bacterium]